MVPFDRFVSIRSLFHRHVPDPDAQFSNGRICTYFDHPGWILPALPDIYVMWVVPFPASCRTTMDRSVRMLAGF